MMRSIHPDSRNIVQKAFLSSQSLCAAPKVQLAGQITQLKSWLQRNQYLSLGLLISTWLKQWIATSSRRKGIKLWKQVGVSDTVPFSQSTAQYGHRWEHFIFLMNVRWIFPSRLEMTNPIISWNHRIYEQNIANQRRLMCFHASLFRSMWFIGSCQKINTWFILRINRYPQSAGRKNLVFRICSETAACECR